MAALVLLSLLVVAPVAVAQSGPVVHAIDDTPEGEPTYRFDPSNLTVVAGSSFTFLGGKNEPHTLTHDAEPGARLFDSGRVDPGNSTTLTAPATAGRYAFHCIYHPGMRGTLLVVDGPRVTSTPLQESTKASPGAGIVLVLTLTFALAVAIRRRRPRA